MKPLIVERFADNGEHSHFELIDLENGELLWSDGFKIYKCTDCNWTNIKKDNRQIRVGFCDNCEHPLWNDDVS